MDITAAELELLREYASGEMLSWDASEVSALRAVCRVVLRMHEGFPRHDRGGFDPVDSPVHERIRVTLEDQVFKLVPGGDLIP